MGFDREEQRERERLLFFYLSECDRLTKLGDDQEEKGEWNAAADSWAQAMEARIAADTVAQGLYVEDKSV